MKRQPVGCYLFWIRKRGINKLTTEYIVEAKTREELRKCAELLRKKLGLENTLRIPIVHLLDVFTEINPDFNYEIVSDDYFPDEVHADTDIRTGHIRIKESVYDGACDGRGRDRMTIAHEIGHQFTLCVLGFKLTRRYGCSEPRPYEDPEWQAKCFAGEFMISRKLTRDMTPQEISYRCGVSLDAAKYQFMHR